jgi:hypothetical protein
MHFLFRYMLATLFVAVGLIASAPVAQAQCSPKDCLTSKTERIEVANLQPAPLIVLAAPTVDADRLVCDTPPDCLEAPRRLSEAAKAARRE